MATYAAIAAVGQALLGLLEQACPRPEFDGARFELYQARQFREPMDEGISLYLFRVIPSTVRRQLPGRVDAQGRRTRQPLPLDLHYLLTPWARSAVRQHRLLGWALRTLEDTPTLPAGLLNHHASPETDTFLPEETVTLVHEPLSLQDLLNIWEVGKPNLQVSTTYVARLVALESTLHEPALSPVADVQVHYGRRQP
jgi:hypothetical protein